MEGFITFAAHDSIPEIKKEADIVCEGKNDEKVIQQAINRCIDEGKNLYFFNGTYVLDEFYDFGDNGPKTALCFPNAKREISVIGQNIPYVNKNDGVRFYASAKALETVGEEGVDVIRTTWRDIGLSSGSSLRLENMCVMLSHNQKPVRCVDLRRCDRPELKNVRFCAYVDMNAGFGNPPPIAVKGCIGLTMTDGSNHSYSNYTDVLATGFYEGIQIGGEHVVMINCGAIMNYYGLTFGNYPLNCGANHPITLINCLDERNVNLPLFHECGDGDGKGGRLYGEQEVTMINFNIERIAEQSPGKVLGDLMRETTPGMWRGQITFTAQPAWCHLNEKAFKLWESDGSGKGIRTRNACHKDVCTTEERLSYYPTLGQQIFDTDLNCMVICTDPENKKWVDFMGKEV